ncbi:MAG TPA: lipase maturation factor family protein [Elusimicrobiota bacterium]|nr:lipase maturation factor family protein [Elusimicrobiota bacterium]
MRRLSTSSGGERWWLTRFVFLRALGLVYLVAFLAFAFQYKALVGANGLLPAARYLDFIRENLPGPLSRFCAAPTWLWLSCSDRALAATAWAGVLLSLAAAAGTTNALVWLALWALYSSIVNVGQTFYGYGWETMTLEAGFLAVFLCPIRTWKPFPSDDPPPRVVLWLIRWLLFRVMLGAGLIKLRGDACWRQLTCLDTFFETQPIPNPLSRFFNGLPHAVLKLGVLFNHFTELIVPWFLLLGGPWRALAGAASGIFQGILIAGGNLSWLNYLTIALCLACFDDRLLSRVLPRSLTRRAPAGPDPQPRPGRRIAVWSLAGVVGVLSVAPVLNMISPGQQMNASFEPFHLVNTYGAFGSVPSERLTVVFQGTQDAADGPSARWADYDYKCQPTDPAKRPCWLSPYQLRLDWQVWFLPFYPAGSDPWVERLVEKLLLGDRETLGLFASDPFHGARPRLVRAELYRYRFAPEGGGDWWTRERLGEYLAPVGLAPDPKTRAQ